MDRIKECRLEDVLSLITSQYLTKDSMDETMNFIHYLYQDNPKKEKSLPECADHLCKLFPQFESEDFEESYFELCNVIAQTRVVQIWDELLKNWLAFQKMKYGETLQVPCLPRTRQR